MNLKLDLKQLFIFLLLYVLTLFPSAVNADNIGYLFNLAYQIIQFSFILIFYSQFESKKINIEISLRSTIALILSVLLMVATSWTEITRSLNSDEIFYARLINQHALIFLEKINFLGRPKLVVVLITFLLIALNIVIFRFCYRRRILFILFLLACLITKLISSSLFTFSLLHQIGWGALTSVTQLIFFGENISYRIDKLVIFVLGVCLLVNAYGHKRNIKLVFFVVLSVLIFQHPLVKFSVLSNEPSVFTFFIISLIVAATKFKIDSNNLMLIVLCGICLRLNCIFILPIIFLKISLKNKKIPYKYLLLCLAVSVPRFLEVYFLTNVKSNSSLVSNFEPALSCLYNNLGIFGILSIILAVLFLIKNKYYHLIIIPVLFGGITLMLSEKLIIAPRYIFEFSVPFIILGMIVLCTINMKYKILNGMIASGLVFLLFYETGDYEKKLPDFTSEYLLNRKNYVDQRYVTRDPFEYDKPIVNADKIPLIVGYDYGAFSLIINNIPFEQYLRTKEHFNEILKIQNRGDSKELLLYLKDKTDFSIIIAEIGGQQLANSLVNEKWEIKEKYLLENWGSETYLLEYN